MGKTYGVATEAFMLIGLKYGKTRTEDGAAKDKTHKLCRDFREVLGVYLGTPERLQAFKEKGLHNTESVQGSSVIPPRLSKRFWKNHEIFSF